MSGTTERGGAAAYSSLATELADERFAELVDDAGRALERLERFWTRAYGPNEALTAAFECVRELERTWNAGDDDGRLCAECGADVAGNDPHTPACSRAGS
jgi:hypothetical protein